MRAKPFFRTRFAIRRRLENQGDHWIGGTGNYKGADCPICRVPLHLVFDFNCEDPILRKASRGKFREFKRFPLFLCARCGCELSYLVDGRGNVKTIQTKYGNPASTPYADYPDHLPRRPVTLDSSVPISLPNVIKKWDFAVDVRGERLSKSERKLLEDFFGHEVFIPRFMYHHQLGGESLYESWDDNAFFCPNKDCPGGLLDKFLKRGRPMKFLAGVINDPPGGLPLIEPFTNERAKRWNYFVSFYFQICDKSLTVTTFSTSD